MSEISVEQFMGNIIVEARELAIIAHKDQKYNGHDYVYHLDKVFNIAKEFGLGYQYQIAAYLHDVIEDTDVNKKEVENKFGIWISKAVFAVSGEGENRKERKQSMINKLIEFPEAINLKMIDRLANMRESFEQNNEKMLQMYISELQDYDDLFQKGSPEIYKELMKFKEYQVKVGKPKL